ncbi:programmed cell death protein 4b isoform X3 [Anguilla rostrata]|uniref:programmed cell death protein 4b isoform X3 n=1 Tax=Anguilla anguilla TaxID=7936 RepID=UPI0015A97D91|nr:programmed cell death protein 4b isoform X3 [Anguilla anguilla]
MLCSGWTGNWVSRGFFFTARFYFCCISLFKTMATECEAWLNANPVEADDLSDSFLSGDEERGVVRKVDNEINGNWIAAPTSSIHEARVKAKAKRRLRKNSSRDSGRGDSLSDNGDSTRGPLVPPTSPKGKLLDRRSRMGKGRGLPKKGGAGGKGVWGPPGEVYDLEEVDVKDPNYDEDQELLAELNLGHMRSGVPMLAVSLALEAKASHRELTSRLLSDLCGRVLSLRDVETAFHKLLRELPDLVLDTPGAPQLVGQFIARAVRDEILSKSYIESYKGKVDCEHARAALDRATVLLKMSRGGLRIDNLWGSGGGQRPVTQLIKEVNLLLKEYLLSGDVVEAERCLRELEVPHFHHEFVYEAIVMVLESKGDKIFKMVLQLLKFLWESSVITVDQMRRGYQRVYMEIAEINIDVPCAYAVLEQFVEKSFSAGIIDKRMRDLCPSRGRKRFVSEGDGGRLKLESY